MHSQRKPQLTFADMSPVLSGVLVLIFGLCYRNDLVAFLIASGLVIAANGIYTLAEIAERRQAHTDDDTVSFHRTDHNQ